MIGWNRERGLLHTDEQHTVSKEAGLAVSVSSLPAVNIWGDITKTWGKAVVGIFCTQSDQRKALLCL